MERPEPLAPSSDRVRISVGLLYRSLILPATIPARDSWQSGRNTTKMCIRDRRLS